MLDEFCPDRNAVVRVGDGRGFIVESSGRYGRAQRYVITAAHCLSDVRIPSPAGVHIEEKLLAPLGKKPSVWCECLFVDPIADIAVLGKPDYQDLCDRVAKFEEAVDKYAKLVEAATPFAIGKPPSKPIPADRRQGYLTRECPARLLLLSNTWFDCTVQHDANGKLLSILIKTAAGQMVPGMSGSPIISTAGIAIGIVTGGTKECGSGTHLIGHLPGWLLKELKT